MLPLGQVLAVAEGLAEDVVVWVVVAALVVVVTFEVGLLVVSDEDIFVEVLVDVRVEEIRVLVLADDKELEVGEEDEEDGKSPRE